MVDHALDPRQVEVLAMFFELAESQGFILAGGAGLIAVGLSDRPTQDVDLFTDATTVTMASDALEHAAGQRGWSTERIHDTASFRRLLITPPTGNPVLVDLARDPGPLSAAVDTQVGPAYPGEELAARKVLALFDRAALRDFVDLARVTTTYSRGDLLRLAAELDEGFDTTVFVEMLRSLDRFADHEIEPHADPATLRATFANWADHLDSTSHEGENGP